MINILVLTHGNFAKEILKSAELIVGEQSNVQAICLNEGADIDEYRENVAKTIGELGAGDGVLILTDLYGGTPSNSVTLSMNSEHTKDANFECLAGFSFPMLLEALTARGQMGLQDLKEHCIEIGNSGIKDLRHEINLMVNSSNN